MSHITSSGGGGLDEMTTTFVATRTHISPHMSFRSAERRGISSAVEIPRFARDDRPV